MIDEIYEEVADKTLSFGCKIKRNKDFESGRTFKITTKQPISFEQFKKDRANDPRWHNTIATMIWLVDFTYIKKVVWHPVMIGDVLDYFIENKSKQYPSYFVSNKIHMLWIYKRKPIEEQDMDCIQQIHNLIFQKPNQE